MLPKLWYGPWFEVAVPLEGTPTSDVDPTPTFTFGSPTIPSAKEVEAAYVSRLGIRKPGKGLDDV